MGIRITTDEHGVRVWRSDRYGYALIAWIKGSQQMTSKMKCVIAKIETMPEAVSVVHGEWIEHKERTIVRDNNFIDFFPAEYECSNCGLRHTTYFINSTLPNFCPNCGARMDGERKESEL